MALSSPSAGPSGGEAAGAAKFGATSSGATASSGKVYMGQKSGGGYVSPYAPTGATGQKAAPAPNIMSLADAENNIFTWNNKTQQDFLAAGVIGGLLKSGDGVMEAAALWKNLVKQSSQYTAAGQKISPWDVLSMYVKTDSKGKADPWQVSSDGKFKVNVLTGEKKYIGPQFSTTTQTSTDLTDPTTAKALATSVFQQMMGRDPGQGELAAWGSALNQAEQASPVVTTSTTQYDMNTGEAIASTSNTAGGLSADGKQYLEQQKVKKTPEYGAVQAGTTYANALENAVYGAPA